MSPIRLLMLVRAAFIESAVCHHVKIRVLADQSNNFVEMERCVRYGHPLSLPLEDLLSVNKSDVRRINGEQTRNGRGAGALIFVQLSELKKKKK